MTSQVQQPIFDISLSYDSYSRQLKQRILSTEVTSRVAAWNWNIPHWKLSLNVKTLAKDLFTKYRAELERKFIEPNYSKWLAFSIEYDEKMFLPQIQQEIWKQKPHE